MTILDIFNVVSDFGLSCISDCPQKPYRPQIHLAPTLILKTMVSQQIFEYDEKQMQKGIKCLYKMYTIYTVS